MRLLARLCCRHVGRRSRPLPPLLPAPQAGASPDQRDVRGQSALIVAVLADRAAVAEVLLSAGASPNLADSFGATPLWYCGQFNALDCISGGQSAHSVALHSTARQASSRHSSVARHAVGLPCEPGRVPGR